MGQLRAYDKHGTPIGLGTLVSFKDKTLKNPRERVGTVAEITFKAGAEPTLKLTGIKSRNIRVSDVTRCIISEKESLLFKEFSERGVEVSLDDVRKMVAMLSLPDVEVIEPDGNFEECEDASERG